MQSACILLCAWCQGAHPEAGSAHSHLWLKWCLCGFSAIKFSFFLCAEQVIHGHAPGLSILASEDLWWPGQSARVCKADTLSPSMLVCSAGPHMQ
jgi:hypothetical protein